MASGLLDAGKINKAKSKWGEGNKVYTRRLKKPAKTDAVARIGSPIATGAVAVTSPTTKPASPPATPNNHQTLQTLATDHTNSENQPLSPVLEASNEQSVQNLDPLENGAVVKPVVVVVDGLVKINLKAAKSKSEIAELAEMMKAKLERVRFMTRKLEDKEAELTAFSNIYNHTRTQYSGNEVVVNDVVDRRALFRVNSEVGSVTNGVITPFHQLSVSVANNNNNINNHSHIVNYGVGEFMEKEKRTPKANPYYQSSEFLLGKDRLPPESNKRHKSNSGRKHKDSDHAKLFRSCNSLLQRLMKHKFGWVFNEPVNAKMLGLHDYHDVIQHPMDLGTIKSRLAQNFYKSPSEFAEDVRLTFRNAMLYNPKGQDVHFMAEQLSNIFEEKWAVIEYETESNPNLRYGMIYDPNTPTPTSTSRKIPHFAHDASRMLYRSESMGPPVVTRQIPPARTPVLKKPKARDLNKRNMTFEEKQKLSTNLQSLPSEKLDNIIQIIRKNTTVSQHDDEIEVDIDSVDIETLWELDRFVTNYKKNLSKHKRKAELAQQARERAGDAHQIMNPTQSAPGALKGDRADEKTLAGKTVNQGDRGGGNDSSSSSSSSDSSSSDSDSDSSSSDGSDAGQPRN